MFRPKDRADALQRHAAELAQLLEREDYAFDLFELDCPEASSQREKAQPFAQEQREGKFCLSSFEPESARNSRERSASDSPPLNAPGAFHSASTFEDHISSRKVMQQ